MKNKKLFSIGFLCIVVFIGIGAYLWYLYFHEYEGDVLAKNIRLELVNNGNIDYINAKVDDTDDIIPIYYFRVKNNANTTINYEIVLKEVAPSEANDGCDDSTYLKRDELNYELKLDNKVIKKGLLSSVKNDVLDSNEIKGISSNDYSLRVWLNEEDENTKDKHYHYIVNLREIK